MPEIREDKRLSEKGYKLRPLLCELNVLSRPDGSAMLTQGETFLKYLCQSSVSASGQTAVVVGVYGPVEVKLNRIIIEKATLEASYRPKSGQPSVMDKMQEDILQQTFEAVVLTSHYPRTSVEITVQEMQDSGGILACAINASCLALLNSGLDLKFLVAAVHCIIDESGAIVLDPNEKQVKDAVATMTFAFDSIDKNVITSFTSGRFQETQYHEAVFSCRTASTEIFRFYNDIVKKYVPTIC